MNKKKKEIKDGHKKWNNDYDDKTGHGTDGDEQGKYDDEFKKW